MTIFGNSRLGPFSYAIVILLMLAFDLVKAPVEHYLVTLHDRAAEELLAPRPATAATSRQTGRINGKEMPFMLKAHEDIVRDLARSGRKMSKAELEAKIKKRLDEVSPLSVLAFETNKPVSRETRDLANRRAGLAMLYPLVVLAMTAVTIISLLWSVSGRLRDIGWPQFLLWLLIAPVFLPKLVALPLPSGAAQGLGLVFYIGVGFLAFIPSKGGRPPPMPPMEQPVVIRRKPGQFGRLGAE